MGKRGAGGAGPREPEPPILGEEVPAGAAEIVRGGYALVKAENDTLAQMALQRPRNLPVVQAKVLAELALDPAYAAKQWYRIPFRKRDDSGGESVEYVEGLTVKAALALGRNFGNCLVSGRIVEENDDGFVLEAVFIDLETGWRLARPGRVSKYYRQKKSKQIARWGEDKYRQLVGMEASKLIRNVILDSLPVPLWKRYWDRARQLAVEAEKPAKGKGQKPIDVAGVLALFAPFGVKKEHLEKHLGGPIEKATDEQRADLKGIYNALKDGQTDAYNAFGVEGPQESEAEEAAEGSPLKGKVE